MSQGKQKGDETLQKLLESHPRESGELIPILQHVQESLGYISETATKLIASHLRISESEVFGVASFYAQFRFTKPAKHSIKVCLGTACHVKGGADILSFISDELNIQPGEITEDGIFQLERVACFGCCALAPVLVVDDRVYGNVDILNVRDILSEYADKD
jgi:NADH-quinone oxidoreductase subunit E